MSSFLVLSSAQQVQVKVFWFASNTNLFSLVYVKCGNLTNLQGRSAFQVKELKVSCALKGGSSVIPPGIFIHFIPFLLCILFHSFWLRVFQIQHIQSNFKTHSLPEVFFCSTILWRKYIQFLFSLQTSVQKRS